MREPTSQRAFDGSLEKSQRWLSIALRMGVLTLSSYLAGAGRPGAAVGMGICAVIIGLSDNVIRPWVQSQGSRMHPLVVLLGIFGGLEIFGAAGLFLGPVIAAMGIWIIDTYAALHDKRARASTPAPSTGAAT